MGDIKYVKVFCSSSDNDVNVCFSLGCIGVCFFPKNECRAYAISRFSDGDGNLCLASNDLPYGTVVNVPFGSGTAVVYDCGCSSGILDVYVAW